MVTNEVVFVGAFYSAAGCSGSVLEGMFLMREPLDRALLDEM